MKACVMFETFFFQYCIHLVPSYYHMKLACIHGSYYIATNHLHLLLKYLSFKSAGEYSFREIVLNFFSSHMHFESNQIPNNIKYWKHLKIKWIFYLNFLFHFHFHVFLAHLNVAWDVIRHAFGNKQIYSSNQFFSILFLFSIIYFIVNNYLNLFLPKFHRPWGCSNSF